MRTILALAAAAALLAPAAQAQWRDPVEYRGHGAAPAVAAPAIPPLEAPAQESRPPVPELPPAAPRPPVPEPPPAAPRPPLPDTTINALPVNVLPDGSLGFHRTRAGCTQVIAYGTNLTDGSLLGIQARWLGVVYDFGQTRVAALPYWSGSFTARLWPGITELWLRYPDNPAGVESTHVFIDC